MPISVWTRTANPATDPPDFNLERQEAEFLLATSRATKLRNRHGKLTGNKIQLTVPHRLDQVTPTGYADVSSIENGRTWKVVGQTPPGASWPTAPSWQMAT